MFRINFYFRIKICNLLFIAIFFTNKRKELKKKINNLEINKFLDR